MDGYIVLVGIICVFGLAKAISSGYKHSYSEKEKALMRTEAARRADYDKRFNELQKNERAFEKHIKQQEDLLSQKAEALSLREANLNNQVRQRFAKTVIDISKRDYLSSTPVFRSIANDPDSGRIISSLSQNMRLLSPFDISSRIESESGEIYHVTLYSCSCQDFQIHHRPCKHMYRLASEVGGLLAYDTSSQREQILSFNQQAFDAERLISAAKKAQSAATKETAAVQKLMTDTSQAHPWLADLYADCIYIFEDKLEQEMRNKLNPAKSSADKLRIIKNEKRQLAAQCKSLEYQLHFYESLFPWLEDFKEIPPAEAYQAYLASTDENAQTDYDYFRDWISPEEYNRLSRTEMLQLRLDRSQRRTKNNWEIGVEYERYIGFLCQQRGYRVEYTGAKLRLEDMGRDLIVTKDNDCYIIQCKRWAIEKTIHEKHIFQLFGSCVMYEAQHQNFASVRGVFVTTTSLSPVAKQCAERLGIIVFERIPFGDYPVIKCNISKNGDKIYHLPWDQQYDTTVITPNQGEFFASTVAEAEEAGFRHAWRHKK